MLLKLTFSSKVQHLCGRVTWWRYTQSLCHLSVPHLDDVDAIVVSIMGTVALQLTDLKHDLDNQNWENTAFSNKRNIFTNTGSFIWLLLCMLFLAKRRPGNKKNMEWVWLERSCDSWESKGTPRPSERSMVFFFPKNFLARLFLGFCKRGVEGGRVGPWDP